jgi:type IV secretory pathway VirB10-like protein
MKKGTFAVFVLPLILGTSAVGAAAAAAPAAKAPAAKGLSDLSSPVKRAPTVENAERLTRPPAPAPVPADLKNPFNPADFNKQEAGEKAQPTPGPGAPQQPSGPPGNRETLDALAARIPSTGTMVLGGKPLLIVGKNRLEIGTKFTVAYNGQDYELELVAIDRTTFTLRYRGEETTRPIKSVK